MKTLTPAVQRLLARARGNMKSGRSKPIAVPGIEQSAELREKGDKAFEAVVMRRVKELGEQE